jgi:hypothetical protein
MARRPAAPVTKVIDPEPRIWAYSIADDVEIGPKLVVEAGSHLCLIEVLKRANRAAATESDDQMVDSPTLVKKACSFMASRASTACPEARSPILDAAAVALSGVRPINQTCVPARHNSMAAARPIPEVPPMTTAVCPSSIPLSMFPRATLTMIDDDGRPNNVTTSRVFRGW